MLQMRRRIALTQPLRQVVEDVGLKEANHLSLRCTKACDLRKVMGLTV